MDAVTYPSAVVRDILQKHTVAVRLDVMKERDLAKRIGAYWTPSFFYMDGDKVCHHWLGYLPPEDFAAQILVGVGMTRFQTSRTDDALACFDEAATRFAGTTPAPEALYWRGVCRFKKSKDPKPIYEACKEIVAKYPGSTWAKKVGFVHKYKDFNLTG